MKIQLPSIAVWAVLLVSSITEAASPQKGGPKHVRINKDDVAFLIVDHQLGLFNLVRDIHPAVFRQSVLGHAELAKIFKVPVVMTTSTQDGPNGHLPREILDLHPNAPIVHREGEVNAWDNEEFRKAVYATGKSQMVIGGVVTDVCTAFLALSLVEAGFTVFANSEASGTIDDKIAADANDRMRHAGVQVMGIFGIAADMMRDWRNTPGAPELFPFFDKHFTPYSNIARGHYLAIKNGTILPGQEKLPY